MSKNEGSDSSSPLGDLYNDVYKRLTGIVVDVVDDKNVPAIQRTTVAILACYSATMSICAWKGAPWYFPVLASITTFLCVYLIRPKPNSHHVQ